MPAKPAYLRNFLQVFSIKSPILKARTKQSSILVIANSSNNLALEVMAMTIITKSIFKELC